MNNQQRLVFHNAYISGNLKELEPIIRCFPTTLIKFFSGEYFEDKNYSLEALSKKQIWLSSPKYFNDPFDCAINADFSEISFQQDMESMGRFFEGGKVPSDFFKDIDIDLIKRMSYCLRGSKYEKTAKKVSDCVFVSCFSEASNLLSLRMWGHYAHMHNGFCLEYNFLDILKSGVADLMPVFYSNEYSFTVPKKNEQSLKSFKLTFACTKAYEWKYEHEWRLFTFNEKYSEQPGFLTPFIVPMKVYMGCKIEDRLRTDVLSICKDLGISVLQGVMEPNSYNLRFEEVTETVSGKS